MFGNKVTSNANRFGNKATSNAYSFGTKNYTHNKSHQIHEPQQKVIPKSDLEKTNQTNQNHMMKILNGKEYLSI